MEGIVYLFNLCVKSIWYLIDVYDEKLIHQGNRLILNRWQEISTSSYVRLESQFLERANVFPRWSWQILPALQASHRPHLRPNNYPGTLSRISSGNIVEIVRTNYCSQMN